MAIITGTKKHDYIDTKLVTAGVVGGFATDGDDVIRGLVGDDEIHAGGGNDTLIGDAGNDRLFGDAGNDYLDGGTKNDRLWGGDGEDVLNGGKGDDVMTGDADADVFVISDGNDIVTDFSPIVSHSAVVDFQDLLEGSPVPNVYSALIWPTAVNGFTVQDDGSGNLYAVNNLPSSGPALNAFAAQAGS